MATVTDSSIRQQFNLYAKRATAQSVWSILNGGNAAASMMRDRMSRLSRSGVILPAYLIQANHYLWKPGRGPSYPCLVLITFDRDRMNDRRFMRAIVRKLQSLKGTQQYAEDLAFAARITTDERAVPDRRIPVPLSLTDGVEVFAADLRLFRSRLENGFLSGDDLAVIVDAGPYGAMEQVPWWIMQGHTLDPTPPAVRAIASRSTAATAVLAVPTIACALFAASKVIPAEPQPTEPTYTAPSSNNASAEQPPPPQHQPESAPPAGYRPGPTTDVPTPGRMPMPLFRRHPGLYPHGFTMGDPDPMWNGRPRPFGPGNPNAMNAPAGSHQPGMSDVESPSASDAGDTPQQPQPAPQYNAPAQPAAPVDQQNQPATTYPSQQPAYGGAPSGDNSAPPAGDTAPPASGYPQ